jgi:hypothetical protein
VRDSRCYIRCKTLGALKLMLVLSDDYSVITQRLASVPTIMYHGTPRENMPIILSQGLIPNPKKRAWNDDPDSGFHGSSRASLSGIYLTTNMMTATSSGRRGGNKGKCLVVVLIQSGNLIADEDDMKFSLEHGIPNHEYSIMTLYTYDQMIKRNLFPDEYEHRQALNHVKDAKEKFIKSFLEGVAYKLKGGLNPHEEQVLLPVLEEGFSVAIARKAAYLEHYFRDYERSNHGVGPLDRAQAEQNFKRLEDRLTRILKRLGRPEHLESRFSPTARIETPITYSGKNKIIAVVECLPSLLGEGGEYGTPVIVRYPPSGEVPDKLKEDWTQSQGSWEKAVALGKRVEVGS